MGRDWRGKRSTITIDPSAPIVTVINTCTVTPEHQREFAELWTGCMEGIRPFPGFLSASIHTSEDGSRVIVYLQWASREGHEDCLANTDWKGDWEARFRAFLEEGKATIDPQVYEVVGTFEGS